MSAVVLPFERPATRRWYAPPIVSHTFCTVAFIGTREQLIAWGVATASMFPVLPKRVASCTGWRVERMRGGIFEVRRYDPPEAVRGIERDILRRDSFAARISRAILSVKEAMRLGYQGGEIRIANHDALARIESALERAAIDAAQGGAS